MLQNVTTSFKFLDNCYLNMLQLYVFNKVHSMDTYLYEYGPICLTVGIAVPANTSSGFTKWKTKYCMYTGMVVFTHSL